MKVSCQSGTHHWEGCVCTRCGAARHEWEMVETWVETYWPKHFTADEMWTENLCFLEDVRYQKYRCKKCGEEYISCENEEASSGVRYS